MGEGAAINENFVCLGNCNDQPERRRTGAMMELRSALADACMRLNGVEAAQSPAPQVTAASFPDPLPVRVAMIEDSGAEQAEASFSEGFAEVSGMPQDEDKSDDEPTRPETY